MKRKKPVIAYDSPLQVVLEYFLLVIGSFIIAIAFNMCLNPNQIAPGGVSGISTIVYQKFGFEPAFTQWVLNIPLFIIGLWILGRRFAFRTALGSFILPLMVYITRDWGSLTHNELLGAIYGGIGLGLGLGFIFRSKASTGGTDLAAQMLTKITGIPIGMSVVIFDGIVIIVAGIVFSPEKALYALLGLIATSKTIDVVQGGLGYSKVVYIISNHHQQIGQAILHELDRGYTAIPAFGGFSGENKQILMVVIGQSEVMQLKSIVESVDPQAFMILSNTNEVVGEGFKHHGK